MVGDTEGRWLHCGREGTEPSVKVVTLKCRRNDALCNVTLIWKISFQRYIWTSEARTQSPGRQEMF